MDAVERDRWAYHLALEFMRGLAVPGINAEIIDRYLHPDPIRQSLNDIPGLYYRLLFHAQNANMKSGVIGKSIGGVEKLARVLFDFEPHAVLVHYKSWEEILDAIEKDLTPRGKVRRTARSIWPSYCRSILSAAKFVIQFSSANDFHDWVRFFDEDSRARPGLPLLIEREIFGFGFPLACDFLKELGYQNFSKPDIHIKDIFERLELATTRDDYDVFRAVVRVATSVGEPPYCVDKLFWLIGSGNFYDNPEIGNQGRVGNYKTRFFEFVLPRLSQITS